MLYALAALTVNVAELLELTLAVVSLQVRVNTLLPAAEGVTTWVPEAA